MKSTGKSSGIMNFAKSKFLKWFPCLCRSYKSSNKVQAQAYLFLTPPPLLKAFATCSIRVEDEEHRTLQYVLNQLT